MLKLTAFLVQLPLVLLSSTGGSKNGDLLSLIQVYRHGERAPFQFFPTDPYQDFSYWNTTIADLTNTGISQLFELGQYTRTRYKRFIPRLYSKENFLVQSTNTDRTFMSAAANAAGLYPAVDNQVWRPGYPWQPVPVFPVNVAVLNSFQACQRYTDAVSQVLSTDQLYLNILAENQDLFAYLSANSGANVSSLIDVLAIWDSLNIENLRNYTLPAWTESVFPEPLTNISTYYYLASTHTEELKILTAGPFLNNVIQHFEAILANSPTAKKHLQFSAHDLSLACILNTLGVFEPAHVPGFASTIYFELRRAKGKNYINIYYSNFAGVEPVPMTVPGCGFDCSLSNFKNILANITITPEEWNVLCNV